MTCATLVLADDWLGRTAAGLVEGGLYVRIDELGFPDARWTDFVVVVLGWWCRALSRVLEGERSPVEVRFMDGPYLAEVGPRNGASVHLQLVEAGLERRIHVAAQVPMNVLTDSVVAASTTLLAECRARQWWSSDADELDSALKALQGAAPQG